MNLGELHTIASQRLPIKVMLLNNQSDGMVLNLQDVKYDGVRVGTERTHDVNFAQVAKDLGFDYTERVVKRTDLPKSINDFIRAKGSCFLEVITDKEECLYPKVPPGKAYHEMILGPHIKNINNL